MRMARAIRHRGPDGFGIALEHAAGFVSTRLAIVDLPCGWQPLEGDAGANLLFYNGEIYNHRELRAELQAAGERFTTTSDTEVLLRLLEREGLDALPKLNGQFAFAWWERAARRLTLVRDRFGVRPLHHALLDDGTLVFGSEAKALFASGEISPAPDLAGIDDVFTLWGPRSPRTAFAGVSQLVPGGVLTWQAGRVAERRWWASESGVTAEPEGSLEELLADSVGLRLRADVPVGAYLSGGLDSSLTTALAKRQKQDVRSFSIAFADPRYDERAHQEAVASALGTRHHVVEAGPGNIAAAFPQVIRHAETPLVRTAPVPLFLLAQEVRAQDMTVVLTGEGADELFWGYDLFKEVAIRELHESDPERANELLDGLYPYLGSGGARRGPAWRRFLLEAGDADDLLGSHMTRVQATAAVKAFYRDDVAAEVGPERSLGRLREQLPSGFDRWSRLERAAWLEVTTLLEPYLLSSQGDRVAMAHGVEGRFPFLDHRVFEHAAALPADRKLDQLRDKVALREVAERVLPAEIAARPKQPYRAPEVTPFFGPDAPGWVGELLSSAALAETGLWDAGRVDGLVRRCRAGRATGVREGMALVGILSTQIWQQEFSGAGETSYPPETATPRVRVDHTAERRTEEVT